MSPSELVATVSPTIASLGSAHYFDADTLARAKEAGLDGFRMYVLGRGGVLGDVEPAVVTSAFGYFAPALVAKMWSSAKERVAPREAARIYGACMADLGRRRLGGVDGLDAFCEAGRKVVAAAHPAGLSLFAGWAAEPLVDDAPGQAQQLLNVLREHRGSAHLVGVVAVGLDPAVAHAIKRPDMVQAFGYEEPPAIRDGDRALLAEAEVITDRIVTAAYAALDDGESARFVAGLAAIEAAHSA